MYLLEGKLCLYSVNIQILTPTFILSFSQKIAYCALCHTFFFFHLRMLWSVPAGAPAVLWLGGQGWLQSGAGALQPPARSLAGTWVVKELGGGGNACYPGGGGEQAEGSGSAKWRRHRNERPPAHPEPVAPGGEQARLSAPVGRGAGRGEGSWSGTSACAQGGVLMGPVGRG